MKFIRYIFIITVTQLFFISCKKDDIRKENVSAVTVVNAVAGSSSLIADFTGSRPYVYFNNAPQVDYNSSHEYSIASGSVPAVVYQTSDTTHAVYKKSMTLEPRTIYSLYLAGTDPANPDALLTTDNIPYYNPADSLTGVRFINLSPGTTVSVNIQGAASGSEAASLAYKSLTTFKSYKATYKIDNYTFEFRNAGTGDVLATYTLDGINNGIGSNTSTNQWRNRNVTIVLSGLPGSQNAFEVNNY